MHPGDLLYAIGLFYTVGGAGDAYDANIDVAHLLREWKTNSQQLLARFDENKDGQIDMQEWQKFRAATFKQAQSQHAEQKPPLLYTCSIRLAIPDDPTYSLYYWSIIWLNVIDGIPLVYS